MKFYRRDLLVRSDGHDQRAPPFAPSALPLSRGGQWRWGIPSYVIPTKSLSQNGGPLVRSSYGGRFQGPDKSNPAYTRL